MSGGADPRDHLAFVAGATGYTGHAVVATLAARGVPTVAHVRPDSPRLEDWRRRFSTMGVEVDTTPWDAEGMQETLLARRPTLVFALLGTTHKRVRAQKARGEAPQPYDVVDRGMTEMVLHAAEALDPPPRFAYVSALGVDPDKPGRPGSYYHARHAVERALRDSDVPWTIARPSFISGPDREEARPLERFGAVAADGLLKAVAALGGRSFRDRYASIAATTLAEGLVEAALDPDGAGRVLTSEDLRRR